MMTIFNKSIRSLAVILVCLSTVSVANAVENPLKSLWPFGSSKKAVPTFSNPLSGKKPSSKVLGLPSPTRFLEKTEQQTSSLFKKTKDGLKGAQDFGKSLNPFAQQKKRKSFLDTFFPKQPVEDGPATMGEFLNMKRPGF